MLVSHIYASACNHQKQEASEGDGETAMIILGFLRCLCCLVKLGQCFHAFFSPLSVVYTNAGPWRVNNKGEGWGGGLIMLSAKFGVPIRLIPQGVCL